MKTLFSLIILLFSLTGYSAGTVVKKVGERSNVRSSEGAGTTTLVYTDAKEQIFNLSAARTVKLPSTSVKAGDKWTFKNVATGNFALTIEPSGAATTLAKVNSKYAVVDAVALVNTPTVVADWMITFNYNGQPYLCDWSGGPNDIAYNGGIKATISLNSGSPQNIFRCTLNPYQLIDGTWNLKGNFHIQATSPLASGINFLGWTTRIGRNSSGYQYIGCTSTDAYASHASTGAPGGNAIYIATYSNANNVYYPLCVFDIEITARPTWAY